MNISFAFKNFDASDHLKKYARRRMEKLGRFFGKSAGLDVAVVLTVDKFRHRCEVTVTGEGLHINASEQTSDMYAAIDLVTDKVEAQIKRQVSRVKEQRRKARNAEVDVFTYTVDAEGEAPQPVERTGWPQNPCIWMRRSCSWIPSVVIFWSFLMRRTAVSMWFIVRAPAGMR